MKTIHKITLGIALAIATTATCIISLQAKSNIKDVLLSQNVEALTKVETTTYKTPYYEKEWSRCSTKYPTSEITYREKCKDGRTTCTSKSCDE